MQHTFDHPGQAIAPEKIVIEAIARQRMICVRYNGAEMMLAPHLLFSRHGDLYISAFNASKNWRSDDERRLGHFKIAGLSDVRLRAESFQILQDFNGKPPRDEDQSLFAVEVPRDLVAA